MREELERGDSSTERTTLDGAWLRRERERIAIGRRQVADRLGLPESQVIRVEMNKRPVPPTWFAALSELGFPAPAELLPASTPAAATPAVTCSPPAATGEALTIEPTTLGSESAVSPAVAAAAPPPTVDELLSLPTPEQAPPLGTEPRIAAPESAAPPAVSSAEPTVTLDAASNTAIDTAELPPVAAQTSTPSADSLDPASTAIGMPAPPAAATPPAPAPIPAMPPSASQARLRGLWLRTQRQAHDISPRRLCQALAIPKTSLPHFERNDLPIPSAWLPRLVELGLLDRRLERVTDAAPSAPSYTGHWLRGERKKRGLMRIAIAPALHVSSASLEVIETRDWPLPPEWMPILRRLGLPASMAASLPTPPAPHRTATQAPDAVPHAAMRRSVHATSKPKDQPRREPKHPPLSGAWVRQHRLKQGITQRALAKHFKVKPSVLCDYERQDRPLRPKWLPILRRLGFPLPAAGKVRLPAPLPSPVATVALPPQKSEPQSASGTAIDGRWLKAERERLGLSPRALQDHLHVASSTHLRFERPRVLLPRSWWPDLRALGMNLPTTLPAPTSKPTPHSGPLDGRWLAQERRRLKLTEYDVCRVLHVNARKLQCVERRGDVLPQKWLTKLRVLGIAAGATAAPRSQDSKTSRATKPSTKPATAPSGTDAASVASPPPALTTAPALPAVSQGSELVPLIVNFRLSYGLHTKQAPFEILSRILADLREAGADQSLGYEDVARAARGLIRPR